MSTVLSIFKTEIIIILCFNIATDWSQQIIYFKYSKNALALPLANSTILTASMMCIEGQKYVRVVTTSFSN